MVRISRLLGNSDTTACATPAQVNCLPRVISQKRLIWTEAGKVPQDAQKATSRGCSPLRFRAGHWPPSFFRPAVLSTVPSTGSPGRFPFFRAALWADALAGRLPFSGLAGIFPSSRYITGTLYIAIDMPFLVIIVFNNLLGIWTRGCLDSRSPKPEIFQKS